MVSGPALRFKLSHDQRIKAVLWWAKCVPPSEIAKSIGVTAPDLVALAEFEHWPVSAKIMASKGEPSRASKKEHDDDRRKWLEFGKGGPATGPV